MGQDLEETLNDPAFWQARYRQQAEWTLAMRRYLFDKAGVQPGDSLLDAGCGGGAVLETLAEDGYQRLFGIDLDLAILPADATTWPPACADGLALPFPNNAFQHTYCHFTLIWVADPAGLVREMARVTKPGGYVFALAEPDYGGRISHPQALEELAGLQTEALRRQGADVEMGRKLTALLDGNGLAHCAGGVIGAEWGAGVSGAFSADLSVLKRDLGGMVSEQTLDARLNEAETAARETGTVWHVPMCWAYGQVG